MNTETTIDTWKSEFTEKASKLNINGMHYFLGWLIRAGIQDRNIMAEFERLLHEAETDSKLRHWFKQAPEPCPDEISGDVVSIPSLGNNQESAVYELDTPPIAAVQTQGEIESNESRYKQKANRLWKFSEAMLNRFSRRHAA